MGLMKNRGVSSSITTRPLRNTTTTKTLNSQVANDYANTNISEARDMPRLKYCQGNALAALALRKSYFPSLDDPPKHSGHSIPIETWVYLKRGGQYAFVWITTHTVLNTFEKQGDKVDPAITL